MEYNMRTQKGGKCLFRIFQGSIGFYIETELIDPAFSLLLKGKIPGDGSSKSTIIE